MLRIEENAGRTYEERITDAITALPLISKEWTNYNPSDPGITILENLTAFETLQGSYIEEIGNLAKLSLLKLAGFEPKKGKCARVLLSAEGLKETVQLNAGHRFYLGDLVFETKRPEKIGGFELTGIFSKYGGKLYDYSYLADREVNVPVKVFGDDPKVGDSICFISNKLPEQGEDVRFYITIDSRFNRNPIEDREHKLFAELKWEVYTEEGFKEVKVKGYTGAFLVSGEVKIRMPDAKAAVFTELPVKGYCIRGTLKHAEYDVRPRFIAVDAFLFEAWQKDSRALCLTYQNTDKVTVKSPYVEEGYILCFAKEQKGFSYRRYQLAVTRQQRGRFCLYKKEGNGQFSLEFDKASFGYEPAKLKDAVKVVIYSEEVMRRYHIGQVLGYDDQELDIPLENIVPDNFCLIAKKDDGSGGELFDFVRPNKKEDGALSYYLKENEGKIVIDDAGDYIGAELFMAGAAVTQGPKGNIRAGIHLSSFEYPDISFYNPGPGFGGAFRESFEEVRLRFREDLYTPYTCITAEDYERVVASTPGLCIKKVGAVMDELENLVHITVMPGTDEQYPTLSAEYLKAIDETLSERRLITTRYQIIPPVYAAVSVHAIVYVKRRYANSKAQIEETVRSALNYLDSDKGFGEILRYEDVYRLVEELECVEYIYEFLLRPQEHKYARLKGSDIYPEQNCLLYPGQIDIEVINEKG